MISPLRFVNDKLLLRFFLCHYQLLLKHYNLNLLCLFLFTCFRFILLQCFNALSTQTALALSLSTELLFLIFAQLWHFHFAAIVALSAAITFNPYQQNVV